MPDPVQVPFPVLPLRENEVGPTAVIVKSPFAAVLPSAPAMETWAPVCRPLAVAVVMTIGAAFDAPVIGIDFGVGSFAMATLMAWSTVVACAWVKVSELCAADWLRSR